MTAQQRQEFCVRWNSHLGSIGAAFPQLLAGQRFVDVTLACEGHQVHCHRLVLAACSSYFESILAENPCKHPVIILPSEIKLWEIQALVDFMYKGEVNVTQAGLPNLLRCAEQLRIRGLYGSDAALNLNQLKSLSNKVTPSVANAAISSAAAASSANNTNDSTETDNESATTTTTTTTAASGAAMRHAATEASLDIKKQLQTQHQQQQQQQQHQQQNGSITVAQHQQQMQQLQQQQNNLQLQQQMNAMLKQQETTNASNATEDDSADESTSNAYDNEEEYLEKPTKMECAMEDESFVENYEDSFVGVETEHEISSGVGGSNGNMGNISVVSAAMLQNSMDGGSAYKRIRRSEASLAQAAKCVSKGQTFQTVSNMFNIPVSTIRFYMARKGILPKRKRGRGASTTASGSTFSNAVMSQALAQMKRSGSPALEPPYHLLGSSYKLPEQQGATTNI